MQLSKSKYNKFFLKKTCYGGDEQIRTADLRLARAALSQLSYIPREFFWLLTLHNQLSIKTILSFLWWAHLGLNQEPLPYQDSALAG